MYVCVCFYLFIYLFIFSVCKGWKREKSVAIKKSTCVRSIMTGAVSAARHGGVKRDECCCLFVGRARAHAVVL